MASLFLDFRIVLLSLFEHRRRALVLGLAVAAVTALMAKAEHGPKIRLHIMMWPVPDAGLDAGSDQLFGEPRLLSAALMKWMSEQYNTYPTQLEDMYVPASI